VGTERPQVDDLVVIPERKRKGAIRDMNTIAAYVVAAHIDELLAESAANRLAASAKTGKGSRNRVGSALKSAWSLLGGSGQPTALPTLTDYPYRS
jgi:hypothetical protein